jgi:hypothetical protein
MRTYPCVTCEAYDNRFCISHKGFAFLGRRLTLFLVALAGNLPATRLLLLLLLLRRGRSPSLRSIRLRSRTIAATASLLAHGHLPIGRSIGPVGEMGPRRSRVRVHWTILTSNISAAGGILRP